MPESILTRLADDQALFDEVKKVVLEQFDEMPSEAGATDELLGQYLRARIVGRQKVEAAFQEISRHKSAPKREGVDNPAF